MQKKGHKTWKRGVKRKKGREMWKRSTKREKSDAKYFAIHFSFFAFRDRFHVFCDKCIAGLNGNKRKKGRPKRKWEEEITWERLPEGATPWNGPSGRGWVRLMPKDGLVTTSDSCFRIKMLPNRIPHIVLPKKIKGNYYYYFFSSHERRRKDMWRNG